MKEVQFKAVRFPIELIERVKEFQKEKMIQSFNQAVILIVDEYLKNRK